MAPLVCVCVCVCVCGVCVCACMCMCVSVCVRMLLPASVPSLATAISILFPQRVAVHYQLLIGGRAG